MIMPPSFNLHGNRVRASLLRAQARQLYNYTVSQAVAGGDGALHRFFRLSDGSTISVNTSKTSIYGHRVGSISIFGAGIVPTLLSKPQFLLYPTSSRPAWYHGRRIEEWTNNSNPNIKGTRTAFREDPDYTPLSETSTLTSIGPQDLISFHFLIPEGADILQNPSNYIFKVNNTIYNKFNLSNTSISWQHDAAISARFIRISYGKDESLREYAKDEDGKEISGFYFVYLFAGLGGIVRKGEESLISEDYLPLIEGLISDIKVFKRRDDPIPIGTSLDLGVPGGIIGNIEYETISADPLSLYKSDINIIKDSHSFFGISTKGSGISRVNNIKNKNVHFESK